MLNRLTKLREERQDKEGGFTLIELLVVVVIIGILIAITIPLYLNYKKGANDKGAQSDMRNAINVLEQCNTDNSAYPSALGTASGNSYNAMTGCANQQINFSANTTMAYTSASPYSSYILADGNSSGSGKIYCYNSTKGGSVKDVSGTGVTIANATC